MSQKSPPSSTSLFQQVAIILGLGLLVATVFSLLTADDVINIALAGKLNDATLYSTPEGDFPTPTPRPRPFLGIVAGHWGNDSGAVCPDGLQEVQVNLIVANLVRDQLIAEGFDVDLLEEFDARLTSYRALALVSIHADSCDYINDQATGYKVAAALASPNPEKAGRLTACIRDRYFKATGMSYHSGSITADMTSYHAFDEIAPETPAAIIEIGFLNLDRQILTQYPESIADGIAQGILCYIRNEDASDSVTPETP
ncbi:MAG: N-acetylmuramoyl-L-alanine amidase [Anaerolineales bacterium]|jgi:N-acetylmuramoyl-L-alanine amidase|nr:N-acetylmuramoyl-L-alanine amidase [Anaerolineales bacterium]